MFSNLIMTCTNVNLFSPAGYIFYSPWKKAPQQARDKQAIPTPKLIPFKTMQKAKLPLYKGGSHAGELCALAP